MILRWFDYDDPIQIAKDSECEYVDLLASHIERESEKTRRALAVRGRLAFIKMRVAIGIWRLLVLAAVLTGKVFAEGLSVYVTAKNLRAELFTVFQPCGHFRILPHSGPKPCGHQIAKKRAVRE